ncbi:site-2 protease family protein [Massilia cavernae]|uniref:Site-2 protease family protein n=1 Tax=Massilia cavernae TaxID=2320864 RepID=A0A418XGD2_9BURK|nr:site-2 protease family protein [Massilia cavernae]RJG11522.1 site-2 protease family protein [Massilia cavernae]
MNEIIQAIAVYALPVIFAITLHEAAHAYAAKYFGDNTAYSQGRMSMNPLRHIDPLGTIALPILMYIFTPFVFGYAKPVPIDFGKLRNPKKQMLWVAFAGPMANFVMAFGWMLFALVLQATQVSESFPYKVAQAGVFVNILMFVFNLLPIPPLDGGRIMTSILPHRMAYQYSRIEPYGFFIVIGLLVFKLLDYWFAPMGALTGGLLGLLITPFRLLLS